MSAVIQAHSGQPDGGQRPDHATGPASTVDPGVVVPPAVDVAATKPRRDPAATAARRRRVIALVVLAAISFLIVDGIVGGLIHDQRQRHLSATLNIGTRQVHVGQALDVLQIPSINLNEVVVDGAGAAQLRSGPGHVRGTALPGQVGNAVIVGHNRRFGGPFGDLGGITKGASIFVRTRLNLVRRYTVTAIRTVDDTDRRILAPSPKAERLTLVTSAGLAPGRVVMVSATADGPPPTHPTPRDRQAPAAPAPHALDQRPMNTFGGLFVVAILAAIVAILVLALTELRSRYSPATSIAVILPAAGVVLLLAIFALDGVLPATF